ncbi:MAG: hypothetical protein EOM25_08965 [Deltaproteobacteria bacterium]|nr:hypothetical protein [Deltaproteobacteria bacterium]
MLQAKRPGQKQTQAHEQNVTIDQNSLPDLVAHLRAALFETNSQKLAAVYELAKELVLSPIGVGSVVLDRNLGRAACLFTAFSQGEKSLENGLLMARALLGLGPLGWSGAVDLIRRKALRDDDLMTCSDLQALFLTHQMCKRDFMSDRLLLPVIEALLLRIPKARPEALLDFARTLGHLGEQPHFLLRKALRAGELPGWIRKKLCCEPTPEELRNMALAMAALPEQNLISQFLDYVPPAELAALPGLTALLGRPRGETDARSFQSLVKALDSDPPEATAASCLGAMCRLGAPKTGEAMGIVYRRRPGLRKTIAGLAPTLPLAALQSFIQSSREVPGPLIRQILATALTAEPRVLDYPRDTPQGLPKELEAALDLARNQIRRGSVRPESRGHAPGIPSVFLGLRRNLAKSLERPPSDPIRNSVLQDFSLKDTTVAELSAPGAVISACEFDRVRFQDCVLSETVCIGSEFRRCRFERVDFENFRFYACRFTDCLFGRTNLARAIFANCEFEDCSLEAVDLLEASFEGCKLTGVGLAAVHLSGAVALECEFASCALADVDASGFRLWDSRLRGVEWQRCLLVGAEFMDCECHPMRMEDTSVSDCLVTATRTDTPPLMTRAAEGILARLAGPDPDALAAVHAALALASPKWCLKILTEWTAAWELTRTARVMLDYNQKRLRRARTRMQPDQAAFLQAVPHLLALTAVDRFLELPASAQARLRDFTPGLFERRWVKSLLGAQDPGPEPEGQSIEVVAVYSMGSIGTIAQTPESDIDCWVCLAQDQDPKAVRILEEKLTALGRWAWERLGLEVHFFPMCLDRIAVNDFGEAGDESSGSAQAFLLKEEFYRTGIRLGGAIPQWWCAPPDISPEGYEAVGRRARSCPCLGPELVADFGYPAKVPAQEFLGACLWQMVKGMTSPFKSVIKLGLFQKYALEDEEDGDGLLCERLKAGLLGGRTAAEDVDPYCMVYAALRDYFGRDQAMGTLELLRAAFLTKAGLTKIPLFMGEPATFLDSSCLAFFLEDEKVDAEALSVLSRPLTLRKSLGLGRDVNRFMIQAYQDIRGRLTGREQSSSPSAAPRDMLWLSRCIFAVYNKQASSKVERIPFLNFQPPKVHELVLSRQTDNDRNDFWIVHGRQGTACSMELGKNPSLIHLAVWLVLNGLYDPQRIVRSQGPTIPVSMADMNALLTHMWSFFEPEREFRVDPGRFLAPDRAVRGILVLNLCAPPKAETVTEAHLVYATSWEEIFCIGLPPDETALQLRPKDFVAQHLSHPLDADLNLQVFIPRSMRIPRPDLPRIGQSG